MKIALIIALATALTFLTPFTVLGSYIVTIPAVVLLDLIVRKIKIVVDSKRSF